MTEGDGENFDVAEFLKRHLKASAWVNERSQVYAVPELLELVKQAKELFKAEPVLAQLSPPCMVVGDIHGQFRDLIRIINFKNSKLDRAYKQFGFSVGRFMFLGDYVDRGPFSVECICLVFALKIVFPKQYVFLRGNHETKAINFAYGFREELVTKLGQADGIKVWEAFNDAFSYMPIAGLVGSKILCMHGGISPHLTSLDAILKIPKPIVDVSTCKLAQDLLWADPLDFTSIYAANDNPNFYKNQLRGLSHCFNEAAVHETCKRLDIDLIVRAHQVMDNGFKFYANRKLVTIFSAPRYMNESNNKGAVLRVAEDGSISITTLKSKPIVPVPQPHEPTKATSLEEVEAKVKEAKTQTASASASTSTSAETDKKKKKKKIEI